MGWQPTGSQDGGVVVAFTGENPRGRRMARLPLPTKLSPGSRTSSGAGQRRTYGTFHATHTGAYNTPLYNATATRSA